MNDAPAPRSGSLVANLTAPPGKMTARMNATSMALFAFAVFFGTLATVGTQGTARTSWTPWLAGLALVLACLVAAGASRSRWGLLISLAVIAVVLVFSLPLFAGPIVVLMFAVLWAWLVWVGLKIDTNTVRAERSPPGHEPRR